MQGIRRALLTRGEIVRIKAKAVRRGVWFRALTRAERACVDLAIIVVMRVRSCLLGKVLFSLLKKLEMTMESKVRRLMREVGDALAKKMSYIAQKWGNNSAVNWAGDYGFMQYLTINFMNTQQ